MDAFISVIVVALLAWATIVVLLCFVLHQLTLVRNTQDRIFAERVSRTPDPNAGPAVHTSFDEDVMQALRLTLPN